MQVIDHNDAQFDEAKYVVVNRHDLYELLRNLANAVEHLEDNHVVSAYKSLDNIYQMLGSIARMDNRLFTFGEDEIGPDIHRGG